MSQSTNTSKFSLFWGLSLGLNLLLIIILYFIHQMVSIDDFSNISLPLYTVIPGGLLLLGIWALTKSDKIIDLPKSSLLFLVISFGFSLAAEQTWNLYEHVLDIDPYPSIADFFYVAAPIFMFIALVLFLKPLRKQISRKNILFACFLSSILLAPTVMATYEVGIEDDPIEIFVALLYPIVDSLLLIPAIITILFSVLNKRNFFWIMILSGIIVLIAADTIFLYLVIDDAYVDGHPVDILWISSYTIWAFMMYYLIHKSKFVKEKKTEVEISEQYKIQGVERFGVLIALILINVSIGIVLVSMNSFMKTDVNSDILSYFSWFLIMMVIVFSSIIIFLNTKLNKTLAHKTMKIEEMSQELIKSERLSAIGSLASRISHDLRNPLSIIIASNAIIKKKSSDENVIKNSQIIERSADRIQHQVEKVLDFVRLRPLTIKDVSLDELIDNTLNTIKVPDGISIEKSNTNTNMNIDEEQFGIVINNIIYNAIQKLKDKGTISIIYEETTEHVLKIQDSGDPIPEDIIEKIFEPLFTTKYQGTGLGLASCKQIVKQHGGTIKAENNPTTFIITIPKELNSV